MGKVLIDSANVQQADITCSNGVIHVIDSVLVPAARLRLAGGEQGWNSNAWKTVLDGVMGGRSSGNFNIEDNTMVFTGTVNNAGGGFASVRSSWAAKDLSKHAGIWVALEAAAFNSGKAPLALHVQLTDRSSSYALLLQLPCL